MSSLLMIMEDVRLKTTLAINQIIAETNIPAYLMEGILQGCLADIRAAKASELRAEMLSEQQTETEEPESCKTEEPENCKTEEGDG